MDEGAVAEQICRAAYELWLRGLMVGDHGLISVELHRRRYLVTPPPPGRRRSELKPADLITVDLGGASVVGSQVIDPAQWLPHRLAHQCGATGESGPQNTAAGAGAAVLAQPPMTTALLRRRPDASTIELVGGPCIAVVAAADEQTLRTAIEANQVVAVAGMGLLCFARDLATTLNLVETVEHAATVEVVSG